MTAVSTTTTILAVIGDEPFGYVRYDAQFKRAEQLRRDGGAVRIMSERELAQLLSPCGTEAIRAEA